MSYRMPLDWINRHVRGAERQGLAFDHVIATSMIDLRHGDNRDIIGPAQYLLLCLNTALGLDDAAHGLAHSRIDPRYTALGLRLALGCATLEDAILGVAKLYRAAAGAVQIELKTTHDAAILSVGADSGGADAVMLEEIYLSWIFMHCLYYLGQAMPVISVTTRDPLHFNLGRDHFAVGAPVHFGSVTSMRFARSLLGRRTTSRAGANPHWECFRLWLDFIEHRDTGDAGVDASRRPHLKAMAAHAGVSTSTMRRRLLASDGGFRHARERTLVAAAVRKLRGSDDSVEAIASDLGYADARSLRRFLKAATGETPQQLRTSTSALPGNDGAVRERLKLIGAAMGR